MQKLYVIDRTVHWLSAALLLYMLLNMSALLHTVDWTVKGQIAHRQDALSSHAIVGLLLLAITLFRLVFGWLNQHQLPRTQAKGKTHQGIIQITHLALYLCIFTLVGSGLAMLLNYDIPLHLLGYEIAPDKQAYWDTYPDFHAIHMAARSAIWWLIALHFVGIMAAKR